MPRPRARPKSFRDIAAELSDEKSAQFHEKWVVGYGHASVAEHAVLHLAIENVSRVAIESIESNRLASYTEKSTRYQKWDADAFTIRPELEAHPAARGHIFQPAACFSRLIRIAGSCPRTSGGRAPRRETRTDEAYDRRIRSQYVDSCRFLLPAAALANVGMTANARVLENAIRKMRSHPLAEVREIGEEIKDVAQGEVPTLVKYAEPVPYLIETSKELATIAPPAKTRGIEDWCTLIDYDRAGEEKVLAAALYRFGEMGYSEALTYVRELAPTKKSDLADALLKRLERYDTPLRELEYATYTFDLVMDQGAYAEFKRHRMMSQTPQSLTCRLGYAVPKRITEAGFEIPLPQSHGAGRHSL